MLPRAVWENLKVDLQRRPAFYPKAADRRAIRVARDLVRSYIPRLSQRLHLLPINSMQWSSTMIGLDGHYIAVIDIEQANAVSLLMARAVWLERPIFSYVEFMVRSAEVIYDDGDLALAFHIAERANQRLHEYARESDNWPGIFRPQLIEEDLIDVMGSHVVLRAITAHEIAHIVQRTERDSAGHIFETAKTAYHSSRWEGSRLGGDYTFDRYIKPDIIQKFRGGGLYDGDITLGVRLATRMPEIEHNQLLEVEADAFGLLAATQAAGETNVQPDRVFGILLGNFENFERLKMLRHILPQLPRGQRDGNVLIERSNLCARQSVFVRLVSQLRKSPDWGGDASAYWIRMSDQLIHQFEEMIMKGHLEQAAHRSAILARGGINMGLAGTLPPCPDKDYFERLDPVLRGNAYFCAAHLRLPSNIYRIEENFDWCESDEADPVAIGFASALRDLADVFAVEQSRPGDMHRQQIIRDGSDAAFIEVLRSARSQVVHREVNLNWAAGFQDKFTG